MGKDVEGNGRGLIWNTTTISLDEFRSGGGEGVLGIVRCPAWFYSASSPVEVKLLSTMDVHGM
jgi:hypothetical protein